MNCPFCGNSGANVDCQSLKDIRDGSHISSVIKCTNPDCLAYSQNVSDDPIETTPRITGENPGRVF